MIVKDLKSIIENLPDEAPIVLRSFDHRLYEVEEISAVHAIKKEKEIVESGVGIEGFEIKALLLD